MSEILKCGTCKAVLIEVRGGWGKIKKHFCRSCKKVIPPHRIIKETV